MKIKAMAGYPQEYRGGLAPQDPSLVGLQHQIASLTEKLRDIQPGRIARPNVWCTHCLVEGHIATECPRLRGAGVGLSVAAIQGGPPTGGGAVLNPQGVY